MEKKKTKLTISGAPKRSIKNIEIAKTQGKNSTVIEKSKNNFIKKGSSYRSPGSGKKLKSTSSFGRGIPFKSSFSSKSPSISNDFERRKLAEQRATKRLKSDGEGKKANLRKKKERQNLQFQER